MRVGSLRFVIVRVVAISLLTAGGCAGVNQKGTGVDGGGAGSGTGTGGTGASSPPDAPFIEVGDPNKCGNSVIDSGEQCDDGNRNNGDGCSSLCQIENGWTCPTPGEACVRSNVCGNGVLEGIEECDDGNMTSGDGCSSTCTTEPGWICRVPNKPCAPLCGDGVITGNEQCDDSNTTSGDGCSSTCQIESGASCPKMANGKPAPGPCMVPVCGNGMKEGNEGCDCGTSLTGPWPSGCTGPNGLFNGDGTGCSKTCTKEPICRGTSGTGTTQACAGACGNGNVEPGEACDDGNLIAGDGCSPTCTLETGFMCSIQDKSDSQACTQPGNSGQCLSLPVKYRDFRNESDTGGHPDFFYYGATIANPITVNSTTHGSISFSKRFCVPNSSGPARQNDSTARCWDIAQASLDNNGRPAFNASRAGGTTCDCQFTDWSHNGNGGHVPGYGDATGAGKPLSNPPLSYVGGTNGNPYYRGPAPVVTSAATFAQWWADSSYTNNTHVVGNLELAALAGSTTLYRFSSPPHSVWGGFYPLDPPANNFPLYSTMGSSAGPGTVRTSTTGNGEALLCNLWPYWYSSTMFGAGHGCQNDQYVFPPSFGPLITSDPAAWFGMHPNGDWITNAQGWFHDSWFSTEVRYLFAFTGPFQLQFFGDDDTFIFINGHLVIDLGGVHQRLPGKVSVDANGNATIQEGGNIYMACTNPAGQTNCPPPPPAGAMIGDIIPCAGGADPQTKQAFNGTCAGGTCDCRARALTAAQIGLTPAAAGQPANTYEIAVFSRDGHPTESNFQLTLSGFATRQTVCQARCGDGVVTGGEECDCGDGSVPVPASCTAANSDATYNGCTTQCKWGPYCGDGTVQSPQEDCDLGSKNNMAGYSLTQGGGCTPGCKWPPYCGDGIVQTEFGEQCDLGAANGPPPSCCTADCKTNIDGC